MSAFSIKDRCLMPYIDGDVCQCWLAKGHDGDCEEANRQARDHRLATVHHFTDDELAAHDRALAESIATAIAARASQVYPPDIFVSPTSVQYDEINALLKRERGHMLDGIAGDVMRRAHAGIVHEIRDDFEGFMARAEAGE